MRTLPRVLASSIAALIVSAACATDIHAEWQPGPTLVKGSAASIDRVEACADGASGTFVGWQESEPARQTLRVLHLLADGNVDPLWPAAGVVVRDSVVLERPCFALLPDHLGGVYAWWMEETTLRLAHVASDGQTVISGWPAGGRVLGEMTGVTPYPSVVGDGGFGICAVWASGSGIDGVHLGPNGEALGGWPLAGRTILAGGGKWWPRLATAPDGGAYLAWVQYRSDTTVFPRAYRLLRLTPAGLPAAGWAADGIEVMHNHGARYPSTNAMVAVGADGRGGAFVFALDPTTTASYGSPTNGRLFRFTATGGAATDWPSGGVLVTNEPALIEGEEGAVSVCSDGRDGALAGYQSNPYTDTAAQFCYELYLPDGSWPPGFNTGALVYFSGHDAVVAPFGGVYAASFLPCGPTGPWQQSARLELEQIRAEGGWTYWAEYQSEDYICFYGDLALAPTTDGGVIFFFSRTYGALGLYALRFSRLGRTVAIDPSPSPPALALRSLRFVAGSGVRARVALTGGAATLELFDLAGRRVAGERLEDARGEREVTLAGTERLEAGLFFARLSARDGTRLGRVIVTP